MAQNTGQKIVVTLISAIIFNSDYATVAPAYIRRHHIFTYCYLGANLAEPQLTALANYCRAIATLKRSSGVIR
jgi:hypothetical protein